MAVTFDSVIEYNWRRIPYVSQCAGQPWLRWRVLRGYSGAAVEVGVQIVLVPVQLRYTHDRGYRCYKGSYRGGMVQCFRTFVAKILI